MLLELVCENPDCLRSDTREAWDADVRVVDDGDGGYEYIEKSDHDPADCFGGLSCPDCSEIGEEI